MKSKAILVAMVSLLVGVGVIPALAHFITSDVTGLFPYFPGDRVRFDTIHKIKTCSNNGDGETCAQGVDFKAESSCQAYLLGQWANCAGSSFSSVRHYPDYTQGTAVFWIGPCGLNDDNITYRTRGRGWIKHLGVWYASPWSVGPSRTVRCGQLS